MNQSIFLFSAGWRSGSTLLQRLISSSNEALIWGESGGALNNFADAGIRYEQMLGNGGKRFKYGYGGNGEKEYVAFQTSRDKKNHQWCACMNPPWDHIEYAYKNFFNNLYGEPTSDLGYKRWGVKEVLSGIETARFFRRIFPDSKFIFLVRNPFDTILSIKRHDWMDYDLHPFPLLRCANHWKILACEFKQADFGLLIRYEDLVNDPSTIDRIRHYLNIEDISYDFISRSRVDWESINNTPLNSIESIFIKTYLRKELALYNYKDPKRA